MGGASFRITHQQQYVDPKGGLNGSALKKKQNTSTSTGDEEVEVLIPSHSDDSSMNENTEATPRPHQNRTLFLKVLKHPVPIPAIHREREAAKARVVSGDDCFFDGCRRNLLRNKPAAMWTRRRAVPMMVGCLNCQHSVLNTTGFKMGKNISKPLIQGMYGTLVSPVS
jgi:hypothetical protein